MRQAIKEYPAVSQAKTPQFPSTRYQGSKAKLSEWIWAQLAELEFTTCLDAFGGTGAVAYRLKQVGKQVTYNDLLRFNYQVGRALIENKAVRLEAEEVEWLIQRQAEIDYPHFIRDNFHGIYFTEAENFWLDQTITNLRQLRDPYKFALAFFALGQACLIKRPYNLFHRKNLYLRLANVPRSFGNKATWDKSFEYWFRVFVAEANRAVFDNGQPNQALNGDAAELPGHYELVYIDPPYISKGGVPVDYLHFYHFLEGLANYEGWGPALDLESKHRRLKLQPNPWTDRRQIYNAFERLCRRYQESIMVISYRSDGIPTEAELVTLLNRYKREVRVEHFGLYKYALSKNSNSKEILLIGI